MMFDKNKLEEVLRRIQYSDLLSFEDMSHLVHGLPGWEDMVWDLEYQTSISTDEANLLRNRPWLGNAFSLQMLEGDDFTISIKEIGKKEIPYSCPSCIGHMDTARAVGNILNRYIPVNRVHITLHKGDTYYVAQLVGGRLPEGATELPDGCTFKFWEVKVN